MEKNAGNIRSPKWVYRLLRRYAVAHPKEADVVEVSSRAKENCLLTSATQGMYGY